MLSASPTVRTMCRLAHELEHLKAEKFSTSEIRRDLRDFRTRGFCQRVYGKPGATVTAHDGP